MSDDLTSWPPDGFPEPPGGFKDVFPRHHPYLLVFPDDVVIPDHCTPEMIADPSLGACARMREGCIELGPWKPFCSGYVCGACLRADQAQVTNGEYRNHGLPM